MDKFLEFAKITKVICEQKIKLTKYLSKKVKGKFEQKIRNLLLLS
jgi:hypothetical protein